MRSRQSTPVGRSRNLPSVKVECQMNLACSANELEQLLDDVAFTRNFGFVLHEIADGQCSIDVPFQEAFERPGGIVSGQVFMAAADVAMWLAIKTKLGLTDASVTAENEDKLPGRCEESGVSLHCQGAKAGPPPDLRSGRMRGRKRQATHAPHGDIYPPRTIFNLIVPAISQCLGIAVGPC
jgi:acyl-coenzyme A thioesterase PaaI-like protein